MPVNFSRNALLEGRIEDGLPDKQSTNVLFAGPTAKNADRAALAKAQDMSKMGISREDVLTKTGWFQRSDGAWSFEIPDEQAMLLYKPKIGRIENYYDVMSHPRLREAYPPFAGDRQFEPPEIEAEKMNGMFGYFEGGDQIKVNPNQSPAEMRKTVLHETQHAIDSAEGFPGGLTKTAPNADFYRRDYNEIVARNVEARANFTPSQRAAIPPWQTEDVPLPRQLINPSARNSLLRSSR